jgi:NADPH-dependent 2,4-dienoyl-CoA reductase/sulfur reductase-like enzyme
MAGSARVVIVGAGVAGLEAARVAPRGIHQALREGTRVARTI